MSTVEYGNFTEILVQILVAAGYEGHPRSRLQGVIEQTIGFGKLWKLLANQENTIQSRKDEKFHKKDSGWFISELVKHPIIILDEKGYRPELNAIST